MSGAALRTPIGQDERHGQAALEQALIRSFWHALQHQPLPAMAALEAAARTVGTLYRQIAAAHGAQGCCACGWEPEPGTDLLMLEAALAAALMQGPVEDLARMPVAGRA